MIACFIIVNGIFELVYTVVGSVILLVLVLRLSTSVAQEIRSHTWPEDALQVISRIFECSLARYISTARYTKGQYDTHSAGTRAATFPKPHAPNSQTHQDDKSIH